MAAFQNLVRPRFFAGQLLTAEDLQQEQEYYLGRFRRHNRFMHGWGIVAGLGVSIERRATVVVKPGLAIDCAGNELVLSSRETLSLASLAGRHYVVLTYAEISVDERPSAEGGAEFSRIQESVRIEVVCANPNAKHRGMGRGTPGCGQSHPLCVATLSQQGSRWRAASLNRLPEYRKDA